MAGTVTVAVIKSGCGICSLPFLQVLNTTNDGSSELMDMRVAGWVRGQSHGQLFITHSSLIGRCKYKPRFFSSLITKMIVAKFLLTNDAEATYFRSMLADVDRAVQYEEAISKCIEDFKLFEGRAPVVLDIGCGTGLLSIIAAHYGAHKVYGVDTNKFALTVAEHNASSCYGMLDS